MESKDNFKEIGDNYRNKMKNIFRKYEIQEIQPIEEQVVITQPISNELLKTVTVERWTVYSFTLPVKVTKRLAFGFDSKEKAQEYIDQHLVKKNKIGEIIPKTIYDEDGNKYNVWYDSIRESVEDVNIYSNPSDITSVGNDREKVLQNWLG